MATEKNFYNYDAMMEVLNPLLDTCYDFAGISREQLPVVAGSDKVGQRKRALV